MLRIISLLSSVSLQLFTAVGINCVEVAGDGRILKFERITISLCPILSGSRRGCSACACRLSSIAFRSRLRRALPRLTRTCRSLHPVEKRVACSRPAAPIFGGPPEGENQDRIFPTFPGGSSRVGRKGEKTERNQRPKNVLPGT